MGLKRKCILTDLMEAPVTLPVFEYNVRLTMNIPGVHICTLYVNKGKEKNLLVFFHLPRSEFCGLSGISSSTAIE